MCKKIVECKLAEAKCQTTQHHSQHCTFGNITVTRVRSTHEPHKPRKAAASKLTKPCADSCRPKEINHSRVAGTPGVATFPHKRTIIARNLKMRNARTRIIFTRLVLRVRLESASVWKVAVHETLPAELRGFRWRLLLSIKPTYTSMFFLKNKPLLQHISVNTSDCLRRPASLVLRTCAATIRSLVSETDIASSSSFVVLETFSGAGAWHEYLTTLRKRRTRRALHAQCAMRHGLEAWRFWFTHQLSSVQHSPDNRPPRSFGQVVHFRIPRYLHLRTPENIPEPTRSKNNDRCHG